MTTLAPDAVDALAPARHERSVLLARPATRRVVEVLRGAAGPLTAQEVADELGLHHSGVRPQLAALERAHVAVSVTDAPRGRGRPVRRYTLAVDPDAIEARGHRELVRLLTGLVRETGMGEDDLERFGERHGRDVPAPGGGPEELRLAFERIGFAPRPVPHGLVLGRCPFADAVEEGGAMVCVLHRGLARGIVGTAAPGVEVEDLIPADPRAGGCVLLLREAGR